MKLRIMYGVVNEWTVWETDVEYVKLQATLLGLRGNVPDPLCMYVSVESFAM